MAASAATALRRLERRRLRRLTERRASGRRPVRSSGRVSHRHSRAVQLARSSPQAACDAVESLAMWLERRHVTSPDAFAGTGSASAQARADRVCVERTQMLVRLAAAAAQATRRRPRRRSAERGLASATEATRRAVDQLIVDQLAGDWPRARGHARADFMRRSTAGAACSTRSDERRPTRLRGPRRMTHRREPRRRAVLAARDRRATRSPRSSRRSSRAGSRPVRACAGSKRRSRTYVGAPHAVAVNSCTAGAASLACSRRASGPATKSSRRR